MGVQPFDCSEHSNTGLANFEYFCEPYGVNCYIWAFFTILLLAAEIAMTLMKEGAMQTVISSLLTAFSMPATLLQASDLIDSKWAIAVDRFLLIAIENLLT